MEHGWIIDASNVFGSRPDGWWRDRPGALARLVDEVTRWRQVAGEPVVVVADGYPAPSVPEGEWYGVTVRYAHSGARDAADDVIVELLRSGHATTRRTVVTSDRRLRGRASELGAAVEGAAAFLTRLADIEPRRRDRAVLAHFGIDEHALLGRGGEARVFALGDGRVLRLPHPGRPAEEIERRRQLLDAIRPPVPLVALPEVLEHREVDGRIVVIERRLPGRSAADVLRERRTDRAALVRHHLQVAAWIGTLPCPSDRFGELYGSSGTATFAQWSSARLRASLALGGVEFAAVDPDQLTHDLVEALPTARDPRPRLVHLDAFLGNMLATGSEITALLDFGPTTVGGPARLDPLLAVAYLAPEITPTATGDDRDAARQWAEEADLGGALEPAERWAAAYWTGAPDDVRLRQWCRRILLG